MARLGRVWSVVEPDELGSVNVYHRLKSTGGPPPYEGRGRWKCIMRETSSVKMRVVATVEAARQFVIGTESGTLVGYSLPSTQQPEPKLLWRLDAHGPHPVTAIALGEAGRIVTVGLDNAVRVVDVVLKPTPSGQLYSGGRLNKRLKGSAYLTSVVVDSYGRAYIGSSGGEVFIFDTTTAPKPTFLHQFSSHDGSGVAALCIPRSLNSSDPSTVLLVAHDACVSMYDIQNPGYEKRMLRLKKVQYPSFSRFVPPEYTKRSSAGNVSCIAFNTERRMVAAGYTSGVVALWSLSAAPEDSPMMSAARLVTHPEAADVTAIIWTSSTGGDVGEADRIYTGTEEGRIKIWTLPGTTEDYNHLPDIDDEGEGRNSASGEAIVDRLGSSTAYSGLLDSVPAVRGKEMAAESDDDEW
ncbi:hypothetical protein FOZ63_019885 [Perkinsus olseni]|uniref:Uncharacterized protein n=1 Tax=Perkinsus olseni TaxID=32597 RepID=A0A7J6UHB4_PEROL|nr:hypothetical protein FOZ63_019885 [Perkinsus olseni]